MTRSLSNDLRGRVIDAVEGGLSRRAAVERFGVAVSTAIKWVGRWRKTGSRQPSMKPLT
jgi:transposase